MNRKVIYALLFAMSLVVLIGCGGGGGSGSATTGTGTVSLDIADAKPFIEGAEQPDELWIVFESVSVHTSGGGWVSLDLPKTPFEINLLAFCDGLTTEFATPTRIPAGHITQIRFEISDAWMVFYGEPPDKDKVTKIGLDVPSGKLRTDKQIDWTLPNGGSMSLTVHFDLSQSIVQAAGEYKLKPVLHLFNNDPVEAATVCGAITQESFVPDPDVVPDGFKNVDVFVDFEWFESGVTKSQPYTHVTLSRDPDTDTDFCIYWLVPLQSGESYSILIDNGFESYSEVVQYPDLASGVTPFELNSGVTIELSTSL